MLQIRIGSLSFKEGFYELTILLVMWFFIPQTNLSIVESQWSDFFVIVENLERFPQFGGSNPRKSIHGHRAESKYIFQIAREIAPPKNSQQFNRN